ncbi:unnamed protein product [Owenia fusiformis]|uniref:Carboxylesterase type B domain-containing protein n=1 Tax=Owenia fusiformis TaxID=6347 RepID=A0A8S4NZR0_OWEFU|nr:unnamed protein product [Owenia fusiformis]
MMKVVVLVVLSLGSLIQGDRIVSTRNGKVKGFTDNVYGTNVETFLGIPYAEPPTGNTRFAPTVAKGNWTNTLDANKYSAACPQKPNTVWLNEHLPGFSNFNEDCLYLNVFTPANKWNGPLMGVLVYIHGGSWFEGTSEMYNAGGLARKGVVVVTINYRIGALGWMTTEESDYPGNMGMLDQQMALRWVQNNIALFWGDPTKVTLNGHSVGGASTQYHMMMPASKGLFNNVISSDGVASFSWQNDAPGDQRRYMIALATTLNCSTTSNQVIVDCLRTKDAQTIATISIQGVPSDLSPWRPVVDGTILPKPTTELWTSGDIRKVNHMITSERNIASDQIGRIPGVENGISEATFRAIMMGYGEMFFPKDKVPAIIEMAIFHYNNWQEPKTPATFRTMLRDILGDFLTTMSNTRVRRTYQGRINNTAANLYSVYYGYRTENSPYPAWWGTLPSTR